MKCANSVKVIREFVLKNDIINDENKVIPFIHKTLSSRSIYGGLGDSDDDLKIYLTKEGWSIERFTNEYGHYANMQKFDNITDKSVKLVSDEELEFFFNSSEASLKDIVCFHKKCKEIIEKNSDSSLQDRPSVFWGE